LIRAYKKYRPNTYGHHGIILAALAKLGGESAFGLACKEINRGCDAPERDLAFVPVRSAAAKALGQLMNPGAIPFLVKALEDRQAQVRESAAEALGLLGAENAVPYLIHLIDESIISVRRAACKALVAIGHPVGLEALKRIMEDRDDPDLAEWLKKYIINSVDSSISEEAK
jgi:HEAT repeat protein